MSRKKKGRPFMKARPLPQVTVRTTTHAARRIRARMGTGAAPEIIVGRCWAEKRPYPGNWFFPRHKKKHKVSIYYRYGDCIFVFVNDGAEHRGSTLITCVTIFGPYRPDGTWWEKEVLKRIH